MTAPTPQQIRELAGMDPIDDDALLSPREWIGSARSALRAAADEVDRLEVELRTARAGLGFMADMHERRRVKLERTESENDGLRSVIENAPHAEDCMSHIVDEQTRRPDGTARYRKACTCWKADAL